MNTFAVYSLPEDKFFESDALLDKKFIALAAGVPISAQTKKALVEWEFDKVFSEGGIADNSPLFAAKVSEERQGVPVRVSDELDMLIEEAEREEEYPEESGEEGLLEVASLAPAASGIDGQEKPSAALQDKELDAVKSEYDSFLDYAESFYAKYTRSQRRINTQEVNDKMKDFCIFMRQNRRHVLRLVTAEGGHYRETYLGEHALRSTVFAIVIAIQLNFPAHRMIELAVSCFLHEIGMSLLPPKLLSSNAPLAEEERKAILVHPVLSYNILRQVDFPLNICLGALEHHERENGKGYPRRLTKDHISLYAKIIAVACSYEAATSKRPFKEEMDAYSGIIDILKNEDTQYNPTIVHALLLSLSLYPIGIYVLLSDGRRGQVVDINPEDPKYPIVQLLGEYKPDGTAKTIETNEYAVYILRPLTKEEAAAI